MQVNYLKFYNLKQHLHGNDRKDKEHGVSEEQDAGGVKEGCILISHWRSKNITIITTKASYLLKYLKKLVKALLTAYLKARDVAVLRGTGDGQPTGILTDVAAGLKRVPVENIIEFTEERLRTGQLGKKKLFANISYWYGRGKSRICYSKTNIWQEEESYVHLKRC